MADDHGLSSTSTTSSISQMTSTAASNAPPLKIQAIDIFRSSQLGDIERCQQIIQDVGPQILLEYDERGHTAIHWACLAGHNDILKYYIQCNAPLDKQSNNELAPKPIHWACVNGHILTVDILLQHGISINTTDSRGCTPLILATQYGQATLVGYLIGKGARKDFTDADGDNALHWAAFKGHVDIAQMLIHVGYNPRAKDDVGQTPMHLACLSGNLDMVKLIHKQKPDLYLKDNNGKTPLDLAKGRGYQEVVAFLDSNIKMDKYLGFNKKISNFLGHRKQLTLYMALLFVFGYPLYLYHLQFLREHPVPNLLFVLLNFPMWFFFYKSSKSDPGFIQRNSDAYDMTLKQVSFHKEWEKEGENNPLTRLCHTCRLLRPQRAKHCSICGRCVDTMDHHCSFIHNCIGPKNRVSFLVYLVCMVICSYISVYFIKLIIYEFGFTIFRFIFVVLCGVFVPVLTFMFISQLYCISINLTTNEKLNIHRYEYLKDTRGSFHNPYNRGFVKNWMEFLNLAPPLKLGMDDGKGTELFSV